MATSINHAGQWTQKPATTDPTNIVNKWAVFIQSQSENKTFWFLLSLVFQGVFFLPLPALLIYYFNAPTLIVVVTLTLFFANIIAGMGGAGIKTLLKLFAASIVIQVLMAIICIL
ncbi:hypothetical protein [Mucilaginibacter flavidus]|uniref:hypothetical protein n=1 Tax=Mucilaginibacter flavidus TaxID=2949309 RepID=UPI0020939037|nr:hypothetical protein [Mucilaginibacter flavidus]MCO5948484.1 hypothetical protein [Mucilaginibacter flavidus]